METKHDKDDQLEIEQINKSPTMKTKKISRGMHVFSVVMFMLRRRRRRKAFNTRFWRRVVESVRKVHSEITIMPTSNQDGGDDADVINDESGDRLTEAIEIFTAASSSSSSGISGYASAMSLRDLDHHYDDEDEDDDDVDCYSDVEEGDEMIDEKAEEFIVRFYEQMKMQKQVYTERCKAKGIIIN
ncbi:BnaC05g01370D [Brassica napus]|uniref:BnaC05g01370D protein n=1 Tax=Brassica napus TaxID=3708 RepID=A0A078FSH6_BRANA|nr:BnaC05g01370D [Brassica napus]